MRTANPNVLNALARVMAEARAGNVEAIAIIAISPNGVPDTSFGGEEELIPSAYIGLDMLKQQMLHRVMAPTDVPVSKVLRAAN